MVISSTTGRGAAQKQLNNEQRRRGLGWLSDLLKKLAKEAEEETTDAPSTAPMNSTAPTISLAPSTMSPSAAPSAAPTSSPVAGAGVIAGQSSTFPPPTSSPFKSAGSTDQEQNNETSENSDKKKKVGCYHSFVILIFQVYSFYSSWYALDILTIFPYRCRAVYCVGQDEQEDGMITYLDRKNDRCLP